MRRARPSARVLPRFVPAHPIAGAARSGAGAASAALYDGRTVIVTPLAGNGSAGAGSASDALWQACGARVVLLDPAQHDRIFAAVSHLPHLLAFAFVDELAARPGRAQMFAQAGSGFRDFTRIAGASPEMWRDIALANRGALQAELAGIPRARWSSLAARSMPVTARRSSGSSRGRGRRGAAGKRRSATARQRRRVGDDVRHRRRFTLRPVAHAEGTVALPGSKSISNRTLLLSALARGTTTLRDVLVADDTDRMLDALEALGVARARRIADGGRCIVHGAGGAFPHACARDCFSAMPAPRFAR